MSLNNRENSPNINDGLQIYSMIEIFLKIVWVLKGNDQSLGFEQAGHSMFKGFIKIITEMQRFKKCGNLATLLTEVFWSHFYFKNYVI